VGWGSGAAHRRLREILPSQEGKHREFPPAGALAELDPPRLLENRTCYRLTGVTFGGAPRLTFGVSTYFAGINVGEAVAHEFAAWHLSRAARPRLADLPFRDLAGHPAGLAGRAVNPAISMLTLRKDRDGGITFLLHRRDAAQVVHGGGLYQVIPVGVVQPSSERCCLSPGSTAISSPPLSGAFADAILGKQMGIHRAMRTGR
jgi:hypothetical protein